MIKTHLHYLFVTLFLMVCNHAFTQKLNMDLFKGIKARNIGPAGMSGRVTAIDAVVNNPDVIYVGTSAGGVWLSESGGINWKPIFDTMQVASIGAISIYQKNPKVIWVGTGEGNPRNSQTNGYGVYRTLDGGKSWQSMGLENTRNIHRIFVHPENPDVVFVGAQGPAWGDQEERGVYKTTDGGKTWKKILYVNSRTGVGDMVIDPSNPDKLIVGMWEFRRWPWFFKSGGEGSGMYVTFDGGETWQKRSSEDGLPKGELGRMGLAIAPSNPERVYAWIESKKNALYSSDDGGFKWKKVNDKPEIGNRPFYYADIFVDSKNENRIYSLYSVVSMSEDGGKSFEVIIPYAGVHPDHHAWWIHPDDPNFIIEGNDGGLAISRDRGKNWRFIENLPLAQFYHINYDMEIPYNVMGGMQDNGSWRGPAYVWKAGGIRNNYWQELYFGDGFDVMPDSSNSKYVYAMSQGGNVGRVDTETGYTKFIKPVHPEGITLRFNWNAAIAHDPFEDKTIYYGSQFVHKSTNRGETWEIISDDLTTNDPEKQKQLESGGLTYDVTQAENYTTIVAIEPSTLKKDVLWVGTDDGNLQLTQDGGKTWTNLIDRLSGVPKGSWIPQIHASRHNEGEAYVVINNYRRNDYTPYVFKTTDFGQTWQRIADENKVWGYALSIVQDPIAPNLLFLGTEYGLYVSIDSGTTWNKWTHGLPTASTIDLKIHPREHDLIIGTFGRAAFILDDIRPLRAVAQQGAKLMEEEIVAFNAPDAYLAARRQADGTRFAANAEFFGENRPRGAMLTYFVKEGTEEKDKKKKESKEAETTPKTSASKKKNKKTKTEETETASTTEATDKKTDDEKPSKEVIIEISNVAGEVIRTMKSKPKSGFNRVFWSLTEKGIRTPGSPKPKADAPEPGNGPTVLPGIYSIKMTYKGLSSTSQITVLPDPRLDISEASMKKKYEVVKAMMEDFAHVTEAVDRLAEAKETIALVGKQMPKGDESEAMEKLKEMNKSMADSVKNLRELIMNKEGLQGIVRSPDVLSAKMWMAVRYIRSGQEAPNENQILALNQAKEEMKPVFDKINQFFENDWKEYQKAVEESKVSMFKSYEPIKIE